MTDRITGSEARRLRAAATPGPWVDMVGTVFDGEVRSAEWDHICDDPEMDDRPGDRALIAAAPALAATVEALEQERDTIRAEVKRLHAALAECFRLSGADPDGNEDWMLAPYAVEEVRRLRVDGDADRDRADAVEAERDDLRARLDAECSRRLSVEKDRDEARALLRTSNAEIVAAVNEIAAGVIAAAEKDRDEARAGEARLVRAVMGGQPGDRLSAICRAEALRIAMDALRVAALELEWGNREMRGRPPDHWLSALETVRHALSHSALTPDNPEEVTR